MRADEVRVVVVQADGRDGVRLAPGRLRVLDDSLTWVPGGGDPVDVAGAEVVSVERGASPYGQAFSIGRMWLWVRRTPEDITLRVRAANGAFWTWRGGPPLTRVARALPVRHPFDDRDSSHAAIAALLERRAADEAASPEQPRRDLGWSRVAAIGSLALLLVAGSGLVAASVAQVVTSAQWRSADRVTGPARVVEATRSPGRASACVVTVDRARPGADADLVVVTSSTCPSVRGDITIEWRVDDPSVAQWVLAPVYGGSADARALLLGALGVALLVSVAGGILLWRRASRPRRRRPAPVGGVVWPALIVPQPSRVVLVWRPGAAAAPVLRLQLPDEPWPDPGEVVQVAVWDPDPDVMSSYEAGRMPDAIRLIRTRLGVDGWLLPGHADRVLTRDEVRRALDRVSDA